MNDGLRQCKECGSDRQHWRSKSHLASRALHGPRNIRAADIDRIIDDDGKRILLIEEKADGERLSAAQHRLLLALASIPNVTVWGARGTVDRLTVTELPSGKRLVSDGGWDDYEEAVAAWFRQARPPRLFPSNTPAIDADVEDLEWRKAAGVNIEPEARALIARLENLL